MYVFLTAEEQNSTKDVEASTSVASNERVEAVQAIRFVSMNSFEEDETDRKPTDAGAALNFLQTPSPTAPGNPCTPEDPLTGTMHGAQVDRGGELDVATAGGCGLSKDLLSS